MEISSFCPNCRRVTEDHTHLNVCLDPGRTKHFMESVTKLEDWMESVETDPELIDWVISFLRSRGNLALLKEAFSPTIQRLAHSQLRIGWHHFLEGKISEVFRAVQQVHLVQTVSDQMVDTWLSSFISHLLEISHGQWIYRCTTVHHRSRGSQELENKNRLLQEILRLQGSDPRTIPEDSRFLLEVSVQSLSSQTSGDLEYWRLALQAAIKVGSTGIGVEDDFSNSSEDDSYSNASSESEVGDDQVDAVVGEVDLSQRCFQSNQRKKPD